MSGISHQFGDCDCLSSCRSGDSRACQELVERHQPELLRTAFLLTGDNQQTSTLTLSTFASVFASLAGIDDEGGFRLKLLTSLPANLLAGQEAVSQVESADEPHPAMSNRFRVDNDRSRTLQALQRLEPDERAVLVLYRFNALEVEVAGLNAGLTPEETSPTLNAAEERLRMAIDWPGGESLRIPLAEASIDAPRLDLWPDLEDGVHQLQQRDRQRSRMIVGGTIIVVAIFLLGSLAALAGFNRSNSEKAPGVLATATTVPVRSNPTPGQTVLTPVPERIANVPAAMLASDGAQLVIYQPEDGEQIWTTGTSGAIALAPDGSQVFSALELRDRDSLRVTISGAPTGAAGPGWETEILMLEGLTQPQSVAFTVDITVSDTSVYAAYRAWQVPGPITIVTMDRQTGAILREQPHLFSGPITGQIGLYVTPNDTELYLFVVGQWPDSVGRIDFIRFTLPRLIVKRHTHPIAGDAEPSFLFWVSNMLPENAGLYRVTYTGDSKSVIVRFFDFERGSVTEIDLPFTKRRDEATLPFEAIGSHDGRWLYVLAPSAGEVAIVDLEAREISRMIPLELGQFTPAFPGPVNGSTPLRPNGQHLQISADGLRLYATGISYDRTFAVTDGVWVIDTRAWQVIDHWFQGRPVAALVLIGDTLYVQSEVVQSQNPLTTVNPLPISAIDVASGELAAPPQPPLTWNISITSLAGLYREEYGVSPLVNQNRPVDNRRFTSLARLEVSFEPEEATAGENLKVDVRFIDPATGQPVQRGDSGVRYSPPDAMSLVFSADGFQDVLILPGQVAYGQYRGTVRLTGVSSWDLEVFTQGGSTTDGPVRIAEAVTVLPSPIALEVCAPIIAGTDSSRTPTRGECSFQ